MRIPIPIVMLCVTATTAYGNDIKWLPEGEHESAASLAVSAPAEQLAAAIANPLLWSNIFGDIESVAVIEQGERVERVEIASKTLGHGHSYAVDWQGSMGVRYTMLDGHGIKAWQELQLEAIDAGSTRIVVRLHLQPEGVLGWFTSDKSVQTKRKAKVAADLNDLAIYARQLAATPGKR